MRSGWDGTEWQRRAQSMRDPRTIVATCLTGALLCTVLLIRLSGTALALDPNKSLIEYGHDVWKREHGLPHNSIHAILQDRDGYLWLATEEGVVRFDGVRFTVFDSQNTPELRSNRIQSLFEDSAGSLWIGTTGGLTRLQHRKFTAFTKREGLSDDNVGSICQDREGNLWFGTAAGLNKFKEGRFTTYTTDDGLPNLAVRSIYEDRSGTLWVSTLGGLARLEGDGRFSAFTTRDGLPNDSVQSVYQDSRNNLWVNSLGGLSRLKDGKFTVYTTADGLLSDRIWSIHEDGKGTLWIGTDGGLNSLSNGVFSAFTTDHGLPDSSVWSMYEDSKGVIWIGTPGGLGRLKDGKLSSYKATQGLSDDIVLAVFEDREGSLWIGTEVGGLNRMRDEKFTSYDTREGLTNEMVWTIREGRDQSVWIGTNGGGLNRLKDGKFTHYTTGDGLASNIVRALFEDRSGALWVGTPNGLSRARDGKIDTFTVEDGLSSNAVWAIEEDAEGTLWIGTLGGLTRLKDGAFSVYTVKDGLTDDAVISLCAGREGSLWIGTRAGGLNKMAGGRFSAYLAKEWLPEDSIRAVHEDDEGTVWIGTRRSGLSRLRDGEFTTYTTKEGLFDDCVFQVIEDERRDLWISSPKGVFRVSKDDLNTFARTDRNGGRLSSVSYNTADGMPSSECTGGQPSGWLTREGKLWFATVKGVAVIDPRSVSVNEIVPGVVIENAIIDQTPIELTENLELAPGKERYEFHFTALSLVAPGKVRFRYRLEGFDRDWVDAGTERVASYTHIPPGDYTFKVLACNNDGIWNETGASLDFRLKPYFYQTYWFYSVCAAAIALVGLGVYRLRVRRIKGEFTAVLEERNRMAREIHDTLAQGFVGIALQLQAVEKALSDAPDTARQHLGLAQSMVSHSLVEARRSVWDLRAQALESSDLATALSATAKQMTEGTVVRAEVRVVGESRRLSANIENNALRIGQEGLTNSLKHAGAQQVIIELNYEEDCLCLSVKDDGRGFDTEGVLKTADGHFGLLGIRERVEHLGGRLVLESRPGQGTEIEVTIPIKTDR
jgi:ligand-binding sensor domain-containing protein/anti-sigma regulatory factor (Ser/Thr protein kinase)